MELILLGHIIGDFYLQTDEIVSKKGNVIKYMLLHCAIYSLIISVCFNFIYNNIGQTIHIFGIIFITHLVVDAVKQNISEKTKKYESMVFLIDQILHLLVLIIILFYINGSLKNLNIINETICGVSLNKIIVVICMMLICAKPSAIFITMIFKKISKFKEIPEKSKSEKEEAKIGRWIGILEREIILILGLMGQYGAIGFVLTAKSLARFNQLNDQSFAEKYLVGTLLSSFLAIVCIAIYSVLY